MTAPQTVGFTDITSDDAFDAMMDKMNAIIGDKPRAARKTGKAINYFTCSDTAGIGIEVAERDDGVFFRRLTKWSNEYQAFTSDKWKEYRPSFETHQTNRHTGERIEYDRPVMYWGFTPMAQHDDVPRVRLPKD